MIKNCRSCGSENLKDILSLGDQYLSDFVEMDDPAPPKYPLNLVMCKTCTLVQLKETTPPSELYTPHYGYRSGISNTIKNDLSDIVNAALHKINLSKDDVVIDIGANDGNLLTNYPQYIYRIAFEPIAKFCEEMYEKKRAELIINDFFSFEKFNQYCKDKAKIITAISMFYDLDDPNSFVEGLKNSLADDGVLIIQQNYLVGMLNQCAFDNICHEHIEYYSLTSLEKLLNSHGLEVFDVTTNDINGGSFRAFVRHMDRIRLMRYQERQLKLDSDKPYFIFSFKVNEIRKKLYNFIKNEVDNGKKVYALAASTRGSTLLQSCGLDNKLISAAIERNPEKIGKKMASTGIPIISEEQGRAEKPDYFLILPWFFRDEIIKREEKYVKNGGALIIPLPKLEIYRG